MDYKSECEKILGREVGCVPVDGKFVPTYFNWNMQEMAGNTEEEAYKKVLTVLRSQKKLEEAGNEPDHTE